MTTTIDRLRQDVDEILPGIIADRRHLHEHPELGFHEVETSCFVAERLRALGVEDLRTGIAKTGITALVRGTKPVSGPTKTVLLRADMDALPIEEENDVEYRSQTPGVMHACGHDGHTAMLLAVTRLLLERQDQFAGTVKVLFQPAEEIPPGGAKPMIEAGVLEDPKVDTAFGMHLAQEAPLGTVEVRAGPATAAADGFTIHLHGKGGHGAFPQTTVDPVMIGAQIVMALQTLVSREVDPTKAAVVTVGALLAGEARNVISERAELRGTVRSFDPGVRAQIAERLPALVQGIAAAMRAETEIDYELGYPPTVNDPSLTELVRAAAAEVVGAGQVVEQTPMMAGEDMSYFLEAVPGCFFMVGSNNPDKGLIWGHHHPRFDFDEASLGIGAETMTRVVLRYLNASTA